MKPYYSDDHVTIYHGDCREFSGRFENVDLALTDIPYGEVNKASKVTLETRRHSKRANMNKGNADIETVPIEGIPSVLGDSDSTYVFCGTEQVSPLRALFVSMGMSTRLGIWEKTNPSPMNGEHLWLSSIECCVFGKNPGAYFTPHCASPVWRGPSDREISSHPTPKPLWLMQKLILASCPDKGLVFDPFMGSGTTLRAAKDLGRRAIGIEVNEEYCEIAANRMAQAVLNFG